MSDPAERDPVNADGMSQARLEALMLSCAGVPTDEEEAERLIEERESAPAVEVEEPVEEKRTDPADLAELKFTIDVRLPDGARLRLSNDSVRMPSDDALALLDSVNSRVNRAGVAD